MDMTWWGRSNHSTGPFQKDQISFQIDMLINVWSLTAINCTIILQVFCLFSTWISPHFAFFHPWTLLDLSITPIFRIQHSTSRPNRGISRVCFIISDKRRRTRAKNDPPPNERMKSLVNFSLATLFEWAVIEIRDRLSSSRSRYFLCCTFKALTRPLTAQELNKEKSNEERVFWLTIFCLVTRIFYSIQPPTFKLIPSASFIDS